MRVIIAGSRTLTNIDANVARAMEDCGFQVELVISGCALGVDRAGIRWAEARNIPVERHPVTDEDWRRKGSAAGPTRNAEMAGRADALVLVWTRDRASSPGSANMLYTARLFGLRVHEHIVEMPKAEELPGEEL